jgi:hypothetical protein
MSIAGKTGQSFHDPTAMGAGMGSAETLAGPSATQEPPMDWSKIGKPYKASDQLESVIEKEMARLKIAMDKRIIA